MATKITAKGQLTVPKRVREVLCVAPGDVVEFQLNGAGEVVLRKAPVNLPGLRSAPEHSRPDTQMQLRAEELLALLRGLD